MTSTIKPAPPPKPSHLSSAFTGTLDSDAFRSYIREQSIYTNMIKQQSTHRSFSLKPGASRVSEVESVDDEEEEDDKSGGTIWGTAKQHSPIKPTYGNLANLFSPADAGFFDKALGSQATNKTSEALLSARESSEDQNDNVRTIKLAKADLMETGRIHTGGHATRGTVDQSSFSSSPQGTERCRQPSVLSAFSDGEEGEESFLDSMQQETPKKNKWMHVRDGSAFEHAGPKHSKETSPDRGSSSLFDLIENDSKGLVASTPPIRPLSISVNVPGEENILLKQHEQHTHIPLHISPLTRRSVRALYAFSGEATFNELSLVPGQYFDILNEDVGGGWSLAIAKEDEEDRRGLVPKGWYTYVQEFARLPELSESPASTVDPASFDRRDQSTSSSLLSPPELHARHPSRSNNGSGILSPKDASKQQKLWDRSRPASAIGQVYSESGAAMQALAQMQRSNSSPSYTIPKAASTLLKVAIKESNLEEMDASKFSFESDNLHFDPTTTSLAGDAPSEQVNLKSASTSTSTWRPPTLFGGRSLNRFVPFVTSGAEEYLLFGKMSEEEHYNGEDTFDVVSGHHGGPSWKHPGLSIVVEIHSPEVHIDDKGKEYTAYVVYSSYLFLPDENQEDWVRNSIQDPHRRPQDASLTSSVFRRFNHFRWLYSYLSKLFPAVMLLMPPFPSLSYSAHLDPSFVERRRRQLQTWLLQIVRHPILSDHRAIRFFLDSEEEGEDWTLAAQSIESHDASTNLFSRAFHPLFNLDAGESAIEAKQMVAFHESYQKTLSNPEIGMLANFKTMRQTLADASSGYRKLSYSILRLITGVSQMTSKATVNAAPIMQHLDNGVILPPMGNVGRRDDNGATNEERAWCWREGCKECKKLTRSLQGTAEAFQLVADSYDGHSRSGLFELHDRMATMTKLNSQHSSLMEIHKATLAKYRQATGELDPCQGEGQSENGNKSNVQSSIPADAAMEQLATRCESVLNVTMSEMDRIHTERIQDWNSLTNQFLEMQIDLYEDVLSTLRRAKDECSQNQQQQQQQHNKQQGQVDANDGPVLPSPYESQLNIPFRTSPLLQPEFVTSSSSYLSIWK